MGDSEFIIEYLSKKLNVNIVGDSQKDGRAIARAFKMLAEQSLFW